MNQLSKEVLDFESQFLPQEKEMVFVVGVSGFSGGKIPKENFWTASVPVTAFKLAGSTGQVVCQEKRLVKKTSDDELKELQKLTISNSIIKAKVKENETRFLLVDLLAINETDEELEEVLKEQLKDIFYKDPYFGTLKLNKLVNWLEAEVIWIENKVAFSVEYETKEYIDKALRNGQLIFEDKEKWDKEAREFAAKELLELKNDFWLEDDEQELTEENFSQRITLNSFSMTDNGDFDFWFDDGDIFWGHSICVTGNLHKGFNEAQMHG